MWIPLFLVSPVDTFVTFCIYSVVYSVHWDFFASSRSMNQLFQRLQFFPRPHFFRIFFLQIGLLVSIFLLTVVFGTGESISLIT